MARFGTNIIVYIYHIIFVFYLSYLVLSIFIFAQFSSSFLIFSNLFHLVLLIYFYWRFGRNSYVDSLRVIWGNWDPASTSSMRYYLFPLFLTALSLFCPFYTFFLWYYLFNYKNRMTVFDDPAIPSHELPFEKRYAHLLTLPSEHPFIISTLSWSSLLIFFLLIYYSYVMFLW